jgi:hypothetical protein
MQAVRNLDPQPESSDLPRRAPLRTRDGASAELRAEGGRELLTVRDRRGAIVFEYDPDRGTGTLTMPEGDLRLAAPAGHIQLLAGKGVECVSAGEIALRSRTATTMVAHAPGTAVSAVRVAAGHVAVATAELAVQGARAEIRIDEARYAGRLLATTLETAQHVVGKLETTAATIVERAADVFRQVRGLHQLRAGRFRALVEGAVDLGGGRLSFLARDEVRVDGKKINLG